MSTNSPEDRFGRSERQPRRQEGGDRRDFRGSGRPPRDGESDRGSFRARDDRGQGFRRDRDDRDRDQPRYRRDEDRRDFRRDERPRGPRREDERGGFRGREDRPSYRRDDRDRDRGGYQDRDRDRGGYGRRDDRDRDRDRGGYQDRDRDRGGHGRRDDRDRGRFQDRDRGDERPRGRDTDERSRSRGPRRDDERGGGFRGRDDRGPRRPYGQRDDRSRGYGRRDDRDRDRGGYGRRDDRGRRERDREREPIQRLPIPEDVTGEEIDKAVRQELMSLPKTLADDVAKNLVMVAKLLDDDPEQAYAYSRVALRLASRVAAVREAAGFASYATGKYAEALAEFRAARRMSGSVDLWPVMADCERGMGRPERALAMAGEPEVQQLDRAGQVEMRLVAAGARRDMGQIDAAIVTLQSPELASNSIQPWTARLRYAYADALLAADREVEAREWFAKALEADQGGTTDASDRLAELDGVEFTDAYDLEAEADGDSETEVEAQTGTDAGADTGRGGRSDAHTSAGTDAEAVRESAPGPERDETE